MIEGDIRDFETCMRAVDNVDYVLHQAALGSVPRSINDPITTNEVNISGFLNMLQAAKSRNVESFILPHQVQHTAIIPDYLNRTYNW